MPNAILRAITPSGDNDVSVIPGLHYIPVEALLRVGARMLDGARKHGETGSLIRGLDKMVILGKALGHLGSWARGRRDEDHLAAAVSNLLFLMAQDDFGKENYGEANSDAA